jgi:hypothetical protein
MGATSRSWDDIATRGAHLANSGNTDLAVVETCRQFFNRCSRRAVHRNASDSAGVSADPLAHEFGRVRPAAHYERIVGKGRRVHWLSNVSK